MGIEDSAARYEWLYRTNPHGKAITWLAVERASARVVACKSLFPRAALVDGRQRSVMFFFVLQRPRAERITA